MKMRTQNTEFRIQNVITILCICGILVFGGCEEKKQIKTAKEPPALKQKAVNEDMNSARNYAKLAAENKRLKEQLEALRGIDRPARIEALSTLNAIEIAGRSGLYDKNKDKKNETLIVYIKPIDDMGDVIKAAGAVEIELWDLNAKKTQEALLKSWAIEPNELKKNWSGSLMTCYYKFQFDVNSVLTGQEKDLTLKAQFTDYLTGKVLKAQKVVNSH
jgi:hypothetical protein